LAYARALVCLTLLGACGRVHGPAGDQNDSGVADFTDDLVVAEGEQLQLGGSHCYEGKVRIAGTVTVPPFSPGDENTGWLQLFASEVVITSTGVISASGAGHAGGGPSATGGGLQGSGMGGSCGGGPGQEVGQGGTGGSYGGAGGTAQDTPFTPLEFCERCSAAATNSCLGASAHPFGTPDRADVHLGSGGGAGGNSYGCNNAGGRGGAGGGAVVLIGRETVVIDGVVRTDGEQPPPDTVSCPDRDIYNDRGEFGSDGVPDRVDNYRPGGGGGAGGTVIVAAPAVKGAGTMSARGGAGGQALGIDKTPGLIGRWGWAGGGGGGGRIKVFALNNSFTGGLQVGGGEGGSAPSPQTCEFPPDPMPPEYVCNAVGTRGTDGTTYAGNSIPDLLMRPRCE
jgi:hypothetical protein